MYRPRLQKVNTPGRNHCLIALLGCALLMQAEAATITALPSSPSSLVTSSFEAPPITANVVYAPSGTNWTFVERAGIASNGSALMGGVNAPAGAQVGVLGSSLTPGTFSSMTRSITVTTAGRYRLHLKSAQRTADAQIIGVKIDGNDIGQFKPAGSTYETVVFDGLKLTAAPHQITFTALVNEGDQTAFIDDVHVDSIAAGSRAWSSASTWDTGNVPTANDTVVIPVGSSVVLDTAATTKTLSVSGDLHCADANLSLSANTIMIDGRMTCGALYAPFLHEFTLTLTTPPVTLPGDADYKAIMVMKPGALELHGESRKSWTQLAEHASAGSSTLQFAEATNWRQGDWIVVAPTDYFSVAGTPLPLPEMTDQSEKAQISTIDPTGKIVTLDRQLQFLHYGRQRTYSKTNPATTWTLDERAEVGLLTRNIRIQGDSGSASNQIGGHMMSMADTQVHVSGVELLRMGQKDIRARYPFHWHLVGHAPGQYIRNSSIHESYNRCVTVHGTHDTLVDDNVCFDFIGHGYFLEDGVETNNTFNHNLGVLARRPPTPSSPRTDPYSACPRFPGDPPDAVADIPLPLETDFRESGASNGPATFWISNPNNIYTGNVAAGSRGAGFWYHLDTAPTGESSLQSGACSINPSIAPFGRFENNRVRASRQGFTSCRANGGGAGVETREALYEGISAMNVAQGLWPCGFGHGHFHNAIVANTENGMQAPAPFTFSDSLFVAYTDNAPLRAARSADIPWAGVMVYDQGFNFDNVHFVNYDRPAMSAFQIGGGAYKSPGNRSSSLSFENSPNVFRDISDAWQPQTALNTEMIANQPAAWGEVIHDFDGTLIGKTNDLPPLPRKLVSSHPLMVDATCSRPPGRGVDGYGCQHEYASLFIDTETPGLPFVRSPWIAYQRSDGVHDTVQHGFITQRTLHNFISDGTYRHSYRFLDGFAHNKYTVYLYWARLDTRAIVELMDVPKNAFVQQPLVGSWTPAASLAALETATTNSYYYRNATSSLFLKMFAAGDDDWEASTSVVLCMDASDPSCTAVARHIEPPQVQVTSPADGARFAATPSTAVIPVTATLSDNRGLVSVQLYSGNTLGGAQQWTTEPLSATVNLSITLPEGDHPLTLVATNVDGESFTAIQQIHVGDISPRIVINAGTLLDKGTYFDTTVPNLQFTTYNWSAPGQHVHWFVDGVDQGDAGAGNIPLGGLSQGYHEVEVTLADSSHNVYPMRDMRRLYIARNGMIADFEDGIDLRSSFTHHVSSGDLLQPISYAWNPVRVSRDVGSIDDANYFEFPTNITASPNGTYVLSLQPALNLSGYSKLRVARMGPGFDVRLIYANGVPVTLQETAALGYGAVDFTLPSSPSGGVAAIELRHKPNVPLCYSDICNRQHLQSIQLLISN
jgi:hypothetical protein